MDNSGCIVAYRERKKRLYSEAFDDKDEQEVIDLDDDDDEPDPNIQQPDDHTESTSKECASVNVKYEDNDVKLSLVSNGDDNSDVKEIEDLVEDLILKVNRKANNFSPNIIFRSLDEMEQ